MRRSMKGKLIAKKSGSYLSKRKDGEAPVFCIGEVISEDGLFYTVRGFEFEVAHDEDGLLKPYPITEEEVFDIPIRERPYIVKPKRFLSEQVFEILEQWDNEITTESFRSMLKDIKEESKESFNGLSILPDKEASEAL